MKIGKWAHLWHLGFSDCVYQMLSRSSWHLDLIPFPIRLSLSFAGNDRWTIISLLWINHTIPNFSTVESDDIYLWMNKRLHSGPPALTSFQSWTKPERGFSSINHRTALFISLPSSFHSNALDSIRNFFRSLLTAALVWHPLCTLRPEVVFLPHRDDTAESGR